MPLTKSATDQAIHELLKKIAIYYKPFSTNSKPMYKIETLFVKAIQSKEIETNIIENVLKNLKNYE